MQSAVRFSSIEFKIGSSLGFLLIYHIYPPRASESALLVPIWQVARQLVNEPFPNWLT